MCTKWLKKRMMMQFDNMLCWHELVQPTMSCSCCLRNGFVGVLNHQYLTQLLEKQSFPIRQNSCPVVVDTPTKNPSRHYASVSGTGAERISPHPSHAGIGHEFEKLLTGWKFFELERLFLGPCYFGGVGNQTGCKREKGVILRDFWDFIKFGVGFHDS